MAWLNNTALAEERRDIFVDVYSPNMCWFHDPETMYIRVSGNIPNGAAIMVCPVTPVRTEQDRLAAIQAASDAVQRGKKNARIAENNNWLSTWDGDDGYVVHPPDSPLSSIFRSGSPIERANCQLYIVENPNAMSPSITFGIHEIIIKI